MKNKVLFLITSSFPFGNQEAFLENEYPYLAKSFKEVIIISNELKNNDLRTTSENTSIHRFDYFPSFFNKLLSLKYLFNPIVLAEIKNLNSYNISPWKRGILNTILVSFSTGQRLNKLINTIRRKRNIATSETVLYSYWCNDMATGLAISKAENNEYVSMCRAHRYDIYFEENTLHYLPFRQFIFSNLDKVFFISVDGLKYATQLNGYFPSFDVSYLGTKSHLKIAQHVNFSKLFVIVSCSRCVSVKRIDLIITALSKLDGFEVTWVHIGDGPQMKSLKALAHEKLKQISFTFKGNMPNSAILKFYDSVKPDLFINASSSEGIPVSMMEAMSMGIPVLGLNVGGVDEIITNNFNGFLLHKKSDALDISDAVRSFLYLHFELRSTLSRNAYLTWSKYFNEQVNYERFLNKIRPLIA